MRKLKLYDTDDNVILSYTTDHEFHGSQLIEITGPVLIGKCLVDYPAKINGEFGRTHSASLTKRTMCYENCLFVSSSVIQSLLK